MRGALAFRTWPSPSILTFGLDLQSPAVANELDGPPLAGHEEPVLRHARQQSLQRLGVGMAEPVVLPGRHHRNRRGHPVQELRRLPSWRSWQIGAHSDECRTAPYSLTPGGSRRLSTSTWTGWRTSSASRSTSSTVGGASERTPGLSSTTQETRASLISPCTSREGMEAATAWGDGSAQSTTRCRPVRRKIRRLLGLRKRQRIPSGATVELWLGISTDEAIRMRTSRDRWIRNRYPLIEAGMSRQDCLDWWEARYDRPLERSACVGCPCVSSAHLGQLMGN